MNQDITVQESEAPVQRATRESSRYLVPPVDIYETSEGLTVVADLPGVAKDGARVEVNDHILTIRGTVSYQPPQDASFKEFELLNYHRQFELSEEVDQERISADLRNGVLTVHLPKAEKAKPRQIQVNVN